MKTIKVGNDGHVLGYKTTKEFAEECGVKEVTVRQWIRRRKMANYIKIGSQYFIEESEKEEMENK